MTDQQQMDRDSEQPPFVGSWKKLYALLLAFLAFLIILFYIFMRTFS